MHSTGVDTLSGRAQLDLRHRSKGQCVLSESQKLVLDLTLDFLCEQRHVFDLLHSSGWKASEDQEVPC